MVDMQILRRVELETSEGKFFKTKHCCNTADPLHTFAWGFTKRTRCDYPKELIHLLYEI
ncbi:hypothetical protein BCIN_03g02400 [Botrytis cinerea B05.10]|uniref:Uncharacterized protein n=1 Tax=Botryotinia fuckeliana (strain B05.10) TaxID=332648 RepID=A0A384JBF1_BOTFB|nr:hypothetical protein BCIN_03g02400 [Botrytis cinerea B05.10]ATZ47968.1 hypothetical protein BCIN_03g02400 [Botrytis cinerea B05.10]